MVKNKELLVCLLLTTFMVTVKGNTNSTSVNKTSNDASINYPSTLIPLNASTIGKAIFPKVEIKRERNVDQDDDDAKPEEDASDAESKPATDDDNASNDTSSGMPDSSVAPIDENASSGGPDESDLVESSSSSFGDDHTDDTTPDDTDEPETTRDPGAKEGSAVCFKPALVYFLLLPLCITTKVRLLW